MHNICLQLDVSGLLPKCKNASLLVVADLPLWCHPLSPKTGNKYVLYR